MISSKIQVVILPGLATIDDFLKVQSIVKTEKTEKDLAKISKQVESQVEFKVTVS